MRGKCAVQSVARVIFDCIASRTACFLTAAFHTELGSRFKAERTGTAVASAAAVLQLNAGTVAGFKDTLAVPGKFKVIGVLAAGTVRRNVKFTVNFHRHIAGGIVKHNAAPLAIGNFQST